MWEGSLVVRLVARRRAACTKVPRAGGPPGARPSPHRWRETAGRLSGGEIGSARRAYAAERVGSVAALEEGARKKRRGLAVRHRSGRLSAEQPMAFSLWS